MDEALTDTIKEPVSPQDRVEQERLVVAEYEAARKLLKAKLCKEALKKFKWVFANDPGYNLFLRRSELVRLAKNYPPACAVVKRWRNDKERLIVAQMADSKLIGQWYTLNECLGEKQRTIDVFLKLQSAGANERLQHYILNHIWMKLAASRKYEVLRAYLPTLGFHLLLHAVEYDAAILFPGHRKLTKVQRRQDIEMHIDYNLKKAPLCYEVALGLGEKHVAAEFTKKILGLEKSDRVYASLIRGAIRARAYSEALELYSDAKENFSPRRLRYSSKAIKAMPKSKLAKTTH
jgi:hypothetical protein